MNLTVNAGDAMPSGGTLTIATANPPTPAGGVQSVHLTATDTGIGMSPEVQARAFEPFFTTKANGRGTGLGLASVHGIVTQAGGDVLLRSAPGQGRCFELRLPTVEAPKAVEGRPGEEKAAVARGVILVAEDQDDVRSLVTDVLRKRGTR